MKKLTRSAALATALGLLISAPGAFAHSDRGHRHDHRHHEWVHAKVVDVDPIYRDVRVREAREVCREEPVTERVVHRGRADPAAVLVGAVIGGVIGHQFGGGRGQDVATAAGAVIGANHAASRTYRDGHVTERTTYETRCETIRPVRYERELTGYDVTYKYAGRLYHTRTSEHPGSRIRVRVDVSAYED